ncbi:MAG: DUF4339 domain-containing protein [Methylacidiphilales bacterium]|nr:DUF4339 domain-containing protein [Candidatus Methylacidiphilales bacterium]
MNLSISRDGSEIGEWTEEDVRTLYAQGDLLPTDFYWKEGMAEWKELGTFLKPPPPHPHQPQTEVVPTPLPVPSPSPAQKQKSTKGCLIKAVAIAVVSAIILLTCVRVALPFIIHAILVASLPDQNKKLPTTNANGVRIDSCSVSLDNTLHYHCVLTDYDDDALSSEQLASQRATVIENMRADPSSAGYLFEYCGVKFEYDLYNADDKPIGYVLIGYDDLK